MPESKWVKPVLNNYTGIETSAEPFCEATTVSNIHRQGDKVKDEKECKSNILKDDIKPKAVRRIGSCNPPPPLKQGVIKITVFHGSMPTAESGINLMHDLEDDAA